MIKAINDLDQSLLEGIAASDNVSIHKVYDMALPSIIHWVKENSGEEEDARDIFQEAMIALFKKCQGDDFELTCTLKSFLRIICRNLWLAKLRKKDKALRADLQELDEMIIDDNLQKHLEQAEKRKLFFEHFNLLGAKCKKILSEYFAKTPVKEIAKQLETSESYIKKRKFMCKKKLIESIQKDPMFNEL